jgi:hypothetical protein
MSIQRDKTLKVLVLLGAMALIGAACDTEEAAPKGGEEAWSGADAPADAARLVDQSRESEILGAEDASTDLAAADAPDAATSPPAVDAAGETTVPGPVVLRTATFALG